MQSIRNGKICVTGGAGFIGNYVVKKLLARGYQTRCLLRSTTNTGRIDQLDYEPCFGDITELESLREGMSGCTGVVHLAGLSNWKDIKSPKMRKVVVEGSKNIFEAAKENGNLKTVYISSSTAVGGTDEIRTLDENSPFTLPNNKHYAYAHAKKELENHIMERARSGQPITVVNPTEVYGPLDHDQITCGNLLDFAKTKTFLLAKGGTSIVHVEDVAEGVVAAFEKGKNGERYILGSDNMELEDLAKSTLKILGLNKPIKIIGRSRLMRLAWLSDTLGIQLGFEPAVIPYAIKYWFVDNRKASNELGQSFRGSREILEPTLEWMKEEGLLDFI